MFNADVVVDCLQIYASTLEVIRHEWDEICALSTISALQQRCAAAGISFDHENDETSQNEHE